MERSSKSKGLIHMDNSVMVAGEIGWGGGRGYKRDKWKGKKYK